VIVSTFRSIRRSHTALLSSLLRSFLFTLAPDDFFAAPPVFISPLTLVGAACLVFSLRLEAASETDVARDCDFFVGLTRGLGDSPRLRFKPFRPVDTDKS
jgi:hypothetical protein